MKRFRAYGVALATVGLLASASAVPAAHAAPSSALHPTSAAQPSVTHAAELAQPTEVATATPLELSIVRGCFERDASLTGLWVTYTNPTAQSQVALFAVSDANASLTATDTMSVAVEPFGEQTVSYEAEGGASYRFWELSTPGEEWNALGSLPDCGNGDPFTDSDYFAHQFGEEINWMYFSGTSTGWAEPDGSRTYRGLNSMNRDAMAAFLYRLAGRPAFTPRGQTFTDVSPQTAFYTEIEWLASTGITTGWREANGTATYRPLSPVNRDAMAAFLYRFSLLQGFPSFSADPNSYWFVDVPPGTEHYDAIEWMYEFGLSTGYQIGGDLQYRPTQPVKRDALAAFLFRYTDQMGLGPNA